MGTLADAQEVTLLLAKKVRPGNSLVFISDPNGGEPPKPVRGAKLLFTPSCISVSCFPEQDGPTEIILGNSANVDPGFAPAFDGDLVTPNRAVVVSTATYDPLLETKVASTKTHVRVWLNDPRWPDKVMIGLD